MSIDPNRKDWAVMAVTHGGTVSLLNNLTLHQAQTAYEELKPPWMRFTGESGCWSYPLDKGTITKVTIIGPEGWETNTVLLGENPTSEAAAE